VLTKGVKEMQIEIFSPILEAANGGGATKTMILCSAFLSYNQLIHLLKSLPERDLLNNDLNSRTFKSTEKGLRFLEIYNQISDVMKTHSSPLVWY
jgi:predicted transcriptional regulator